MASFTRSKKNKTKAMISKIDLFFFLIPLWCSASTLLLVQQTLSNTTLRDQLSEKQRQLTKLSEKVEQIKNERLLQKKFDGVGDEQGRQVLQREKRRNAAEEDDWREFQLVANQFPFTRNLERFRTSNGFFIYVVQSGATQTSRLRWSEVRWKELVRNWGRKTTFSDLLDMSERLVSGAKDPKLGKGQRWMKKKLILHCLPKAASTTLRRACYKNMKDNCPAIEFPRQQDPFGYTNVGDFFTAVKECTDLNHFCVQGGNADMSVINYEGEKDVSGEREPFHFIHMVPFRNFDDWVESAIKHIFFIDGNCDRVDKILDQCLGYRELYMELYPKAVLSLLTGMTFDANGNDISSSTKDKHHILLYDYKDVDGIVSSVSDYFDMDPLPRTNRRHKESDETGTCPAGISKKFHDCHDETLMRADAIRSLEKEKKRRQIDDRALKTLIMCFRSGNCND